MSMSNNLLQRNPFRICHEKYLLLFRISEATDIEFVRPVIVLDRM